MEKKDMKCTTILNIVILHPLIIGLIWSIFAGIMSLIPDMLLGLAMTPYILVEAGMFVISCELLKSRIEKETHISSAQVNKYLIVSHFVYAVVIYIATMGLTFLFERRSFAVSQAIGPTLIVSIIYIIILIYQMTDKFRMLKWDAHVQIGKFIRIAIAIAAVIVPALIACVIWYSFFIFTVGTDTTNEFMEMLFELFYIAGMFLDMFVMIIASILMYWLMMKKKYLSSRHTKIVLIFSNILFMAMLYLVYDIYPDFLPGGEGPVMGIGIFLYLTLAATGVFLLALLIISMIEHIFRKKAVKKQALEQTDK